MELIEHASEERMTREEAARRLHELADDLARHNGVSFLREGMRFTLPVPDEVTLAVEIEVGAEGSEIEVELRW